MPKGPFDDVQAALKLASRVLSAAEPMASLGAQPRSPRARPVPNVERPQPTVQSGRCATCAGKGRVGRAGHEVDCPSCEGVLVAEVYCPTCAGAGLVGQAGHEVACPACK